MKDLILLITGVFIVALIACDNTTVIKEENTDSTDTISVIDENISGDTEEEAMDEAADQEYLLDNLLNFNSEQELIEAYGEENVKRELRWGPEGMYEYYASILYPGQGNQVEFTWRDSANFAKINSVYIDGWNGTPDWVTKDGIRIGTTMKELEKLNGMPFTFYGFGWDFGGLVGWGESGNLENKGIAVTLNISEDYEFEDASEMMGDIEFTSDDAIAKKINPIVISISLVDQDF